MATSREVAAREVQSTAAQKREPVDRSSEPAIRPPVNVYETGEGIVLQADMPGVSKERLELRVDGNNLYVEGRMEFDVQDRMEALWADVRSALYRRTFTLGSELEPDKIEANLKDGVLTVRIPKRAELRPRRIEVKSR
jgi:HSP20 family molecular chaperone IbpA